MNIARSAVALALLPLLVGITSCKPVVSPSSTFRVNTFHFVHAGPPADSGKAAPHVWIDTNTRVGLAEGTVTSSLPAAVMIDYTDHSAALRSVVITAVRITYDDGAIDTATDALKLPLRIAAREYESVNSVSGGRIVKTKSWIVSGRIPGVVGRAQPLRLELEGHFVGNDGSESAFKIEQNFDVESEQAVKSAVEALRDG